jgi:6-pyruvoyltetrahydropterin/6-carboxytetrahydropterin synthase
MISVESEFSFEYAHHLPGECFGKCQNPHGHSGVLTVEIEGGLKNGMVVNFTDLKEVVKKEVVDRLDHTDLNQMIALPTAENVLEQYIVPRLKAVYGDALVRVTLKETAKNKAIWRK